MFCLKMALMIYGDKLLVICFSLRPRGQNCWWIKLDGVRGYLTDILSSHANWDLQINQAYVVSYHRFMIEYSQ